MRRVSREEGLPALSSTSEGALEQRHRRLAGAARTQLAAALEVDPYPRHRAGAGDCFRVLEQELAGVEITA